MAEKLADIMVSGVELNAITARSYWSLSGDPDLTESVATLITATQRVNRGDLAGLEAILAAQVVALNTMFTQLAFQTSRMANVDQIDRFTRLALKSQAQCRAAIETLALMKNPPTVFASQANIAHGPQQVNNGVAPRAGELKTKPIELLEAPRERMDRGTSRPTGTSDQELEAVGPRDRTAKRRR